MNFNAQFTSAFLAFYYIAFFSTFSFSQNPNLQEMIRASQNPIADRVFVSLSDNIGFGIDPEDRISNNINVQPVLPFPLGTWNITTRAILPVNYQPDILNNEGGTFGLGDLRLSALLNPQTNSPLKWGIGPSFLFPTATDNALGADQWGIGPAIVGEYNQGNLLAGLFAENIWSFAGDADRPDINLLRLRPFINYIIPAFQNLFITTSPEITADFVSDDNRWTVPIGGGLGYLLNLGTMPININVEGYWNSIRPDFSPDWTLRSIIQAQFPSTKRR